MAVKKFALNTEPHEAVIGNVTLLFQAEANGAAFADAYTELKRAQAVVNAAGDDAGGEEVRALEAGMRAFLSRFLLDGSKETFGSLALPIRVLVELLEWLATLYGGGQGNDSRVNS